VHEDNCGIGALCDRKPLGYLTYRLSIEQTTTAESVINDKKIIFPVIFGRFIFRHSSHVMMNGIREGKREISVVIADDVEVIREMLKLTLSEIEGVNVKGVAEDGLEAIRLVLDLRPDVLVLDISMPFKSGIEVMREIRINDLSIDIIIFTVDAALRQASLNAGANFFLVKSELGKLIDIFEKLVDSKGFCH
jgi:CheY-like chemotaxis protein